MDEEELISLGMSEPAAPAAAPRALPASADPPPPATPSPGWLAAGRAMESLKQKLVSAAGPAPAPGEPESLVRRLVLPMAKLAAAAEKAAKSPPSARPARARDPFTAKLLTVLPQLKSLRQSAFGQPATPAAGEGPAFALNEHGQHVGDGAFDEDAAYNALLAKRAAAEEDARLNGAGGARKDDEAKNTEPEAPKPYVPTTVGERAWSGIRGGVMKCSPWCGRRLPERPPSSPVLLTPEQKIALARTKNSLPDTPKSSAHFWILYDKVLNYCVPHWLRYFIYAGVWHVYPFWYGRVRSEALEGQCNEDLAPWIFVTHLLSGGRLFGITTLNAIRIHSRPWEDQNFGEAMGELCTEMTDGTHDPDPGFMRGYRLPFYVCVYHFCEVVNMFIGWGFYDHIVICDKTIEENALDLLVYQLFNLFFMSPYVDFYWPWCYLEWQKDVDVITKFKKPPPKRAKAAAADRDDSPPRAMITLDHAVDDDATVASEANSAPGPDVAMVGGTLEEPMSKKAERAGRLEMAEQWKNMNDAKVPRKKTAGLEGSKAGVLPGMAAAHPRRGATKDRKVPGGNDGVQLDPKKPPPAGGSSGQEWWRKDGLAPPRKHKGGVFAAAQERAAEAAGNAPTTGALVAARQQQPGKQGGKKKAASLFSKSATVAPAPAKAKAGERPKTAPSR